MEDIGSHVHRRDAYAVTDAPPAAAPALGLLGLFEVRTRLTRDRLLLLFVSSNLAFLAFDVAIAHSVNAFVPIYEWIPIITSIPAAAASGWLFVRPVASRHGDQAGDSLRRAAGRATMLLHLLLMLVGMVVGVLGFAFHLRAVLPPGGGWSWAWVCFGAPVLAPLSFSGVSLVGLLAVTREEPRGSGRLVVGDLVRIRAPRSKREHLLACVALGFLGAGLTSFLDHGQNGYARLEWIPIITGVFAMLVTVCMARSDDRSRLDSHTYFWTMIGCVIVGALGFAFHLSHDLADTGRVSLERMRSSAPIFAPLLFADLGILGLLVMLEGVPPSTARH